MPILPRMPILRQVRFMRSPYKKASRPMPWLAASHGSTLHQLLSDRYHSLLRGLPTLVLLASDGTPVSATARDDIEIQGRAVWAGRWKALLAHRQPVATSPSTFDVFADAALSMESLMRRASAEGCAGVLLHIGTSWSRDSLTLEAALGADERVRELCSTRQLLRGQLCYESGQRWLMTHHPSLHHGANPDLVILRTCASLCGELAGQWEEPSEELSPDAAALAVCALVERVHLHAVAQR